MEVYIEYVVLDNLIINYVLLRLVDFSLKLNAKKSLCVLSAVIGTIAAVLFPFLNFNIALNNFILFILKLLLGLVMVLIIKKPKSLTCLITTFFLFLTYTFVLGGMCFGLIYMLNLKTTFSGVLINGFEIPISLFLLLGLCYLKILFGLIKIVKHKCNYSKFYYDVKLCVNNKHTIVTGFLDSGNQINVLNSGIVVINYKTLIKLYPNLNLQKLIVGNLKESGLKNAKLINITNSGGNTKMLTFTLDELQIVGENNKVINLKNQVVGLAKTNFNGQFDCLLSPELLI
ncbi:MAG: sigma-E processing peptidase SpoIIGA [Clostridia bacterium]|nr:sigma-E processing peptidase SpoIIGA [Clostridia bacterium]